MDECMDGMFEKWYDKIDEEDSVEDKRKVRKDLIDELFPFCFRRK